MNMVLVVRGVRGIENLSNKGSMKSGQGEGRRGAVLYYMPSPLG